MRLALVLIAWEPALAHAAYLLILAIAVEQILDDLVGIHLHELLQFSISMAILALTVGFARIAWLLRSAMWLRLVVITGQPVEKPLPDAASKSKSLRWAHFHPVLEPEGTKIASIR